MNIHNNMKMEKNVRNAIEQAWGKAKEFTIMAISFEGQTDLTHDSTAAVEIYKSNPQHPLIVRVPLRDLGTDPSKWPAVLAQKRASAIKLMRAREGIPNVRKLKTLEDIV